MEEEYLGRNEGDEGQRKCVQVDSYMIPAKVSYFFANGKHTIMDYKMLFYTSTGLSPSEAGLVNGLSYFGGAVGNPFWSYIADKRGHHEAIHLVLCFIAMLTVCAQLFFASMFSPGSNVCPANQTSSKPTIVVPNKSYLFYSLLFAAMLFSSFNSTANSFIDVGVLLRVRSSPGGRANIGMQTYAGSLGTFLASFVYSLSIQYFPAGPMTCYTGIFITYLALNIAVGISAHFLYKDIVMLRREERININSILWNYVKKFDSSLLLLSVLLNGILNAFKPSFLFLYLKTLRAPTLLLAATVSLDATSAVIVYMFSERIIHTLGGSFNAMYFSTLMWGFRYWCTAAMANPYFIFIIDLFHGLTSPLFRVSSLKYVNETTDERICTTVCGIVNALFKCCSFIIANIIGGMIFEMYGAKVMFNGAAALSFAWTLVGIVRIFVRNRTTQEYDKGL